jgi:hypothetical protein
LSYFFIKSSNDLSKDLFFEFRLSDFCKNGLIGIQIVLKYKYLVSQEKMFESLQGCECEISLSTLVVKTKM